jgi:hypothetical protein
VKKEKIMETDKERNASASASATPVIAGNRCKPCANTRRSVANSIGKTVREPNRHNISLTIKKLSVGVRRMIRGEKKEE